MGYLSFSAAIYDPTQPDTSPSNLATLTPGAGGFTAGGRDLLKNIAGHMIASGGWNLSAVGGTDPATYTLSCTGPQGGDSLTCELSWDVNRANIQLRMATSFASGTPQNPSSFQLWPVTNGGSAPINNPRAINVYVWADKESVCIVTRDALANSNYTTAWAFGLIRRWPNTVPTAANQAGKDYTAIFYTMPTRSMGNNQDQNGNDASSPSWQTGAAPKHAQFYNQIMGPIANGFSATGQYPYAKESFSAIKVYQNYGDGSASWITNFLSSGGMFDSNHRTNENAATFSANIRQPMASEPRIGTDNLFHLQREIVWQMKTDTDTQPVTRGTLPASMIFAGRNAGNDGTLINAGTETYMVLAVNAGFWLRMNPTSFAIRQA